METTITRNGSELTIAVEGRLDTLSAPELEDQLDDLLQGVDKLIFDFEKLEYISSAGLRAILTAMQILEEPGRVTVRKPNFDVMEVLEFTGFVDDLTIEQG